MMLLIKVCFHFSHSAFSQKLFKQEWAKLWYLFHSLPFSTRIALLQSLQKRNTNLRTVQHSFSVQYIDSSCKVIQISIVLTVWLSSMLHKATKDGKKSTIWKGKKMRCNRWYVLVSQVVNFVCITVLQIQSRKVYARSHKSVFCEVGHFRLKNTQIKVLAGPPLTLGKSPRKLNVA